MNLLKIYDGIRCLVLLGHSCYDEICDSIKYLTSEKSGIQIILITILKESEMIHIILYL